MIGRLAAAMTGLVIAVQAHATEAVPRPGDIVARLGDGLWSNMFASLDGGRFSHVGVVARVGDHIVVVHAEADDLTGDGAVWVEDFKSFTAYSRRWSLFRPQRQGSDIAEAALTYVGRPFDVKFDLSEADNIYCTELVWRAVKDALGQDPLGSKTVMMGREAVLVGDLLALPVLVPVTRD